MKDKCMLFGKICLHRGLTEIGKKNFKVLFDNFTFSLGGEKVVLAFDSSEMELWENRNNVFSFCLYNLNKDKSKNIEFLQNSIKNRLNVKKATMHGDAFCNNGDNSNVSMLNNVVMGSIVVIMGEEDFYVRDCNFQVA